MKTLDTSKIETPPDKESLSGVPLAIVLVGIMIAGALLIYYNPSQKNKTSDQQSSQSSQTDNQTVQSPQINQPANQAPIKQKNSADIVAEWRKSTAYIECYWLNSNTGFVYLKQSGSGLLAMLNDIPTVITNKHVVSDNQYGIAQECDFSFPPSSEHDHFYYTITTIDRPAHIDTTLPGSPLLPEIPMYGQIEFATDGSDVAYLLNAKEHNFGASLIVSLRERAKKGIFVCNSEENIGTPLLILGYPVYGSSMDLTSAFTSLEVTATEGIISGRDGDYYTTSAKIDHGNSGGLAIDVNNDCYIGIPTASYMGEIESLGRILPASYVVK